MRDRLIQQMFKQILEPICEARFHKHSYGFRPNRATHHAMARSQHLINNNWLHYVVDIDIQGFFDNVNHTKLLKQMYDIGIKDKRVLRIVSKTLKAPIKGDNELSKYSAQKGLCAVIKRFIGAHEVEFHHKKPVSSRGTDKYQNLVAIHKDVHKLIHATNTETIEKYRNKLQLNEEQLEKVNKFRKECNLFNLV